MRRYLSLSQKGNGGKDNPVLSVEPQGDRFTASSISALCYETQHSYETEKKSKSSRCVFFLYYCCL